MPFPCAERGLHFLPFSRFAAVVPTAPQQRGKWVDQQAQERLAPPEALPCPPRVGAPELQSRSDTESAARQLATAGAPVFGPVPVAASTQGRVSEYCAS